MSTSDDSFLTTPHDSHIPDLDAPDKFTPSPSEESRDVSEHGTTITPPSDTTASDYQAGEITAPFSSAESAYMREKLHEIFSENILAKILRVAVEALKDNVRTEPAISI